MRTPTPLLLSALLVLGCRPTLRVEVTLPAAVDIRPDVQQLALVDRTDTDAGRAAINEFIDGMLDLRTPRFSVVNRQSTRALYASIHAVEGAPLTRTQSQKLCDQTKASGVVALESARSWGGWSFGERTDSRTITQTTQTSRGEVSREVVEEYIVYEAVYTAEVEVVWRLYGCGDTALDYAVIRASDSWFGEGPSPNTARGVVGPTAPLEADLIASTGDAYLQRIAPHEVLLSRPYYRGVAGPLRQGSRHMGRGELARAEEAMQPALSDAGKRKKGKLLYDLALVSEQQGDLDLAVKRAKRADRLLDTSMSSSLVRELRERRRMDRTVSEQLAPDAPDPVRSPRREADGE